MRTRRAGPAALLALLALSGPARALGDDGPPLHDRLAAWVPADAAAVFFPSLDAAAGAMETLSRRLPALLPALCDEGSGGSREPLRRMLDALLLPTVWSTNPRVRTGTRAVALVVADPDVGRAADVALVCEVDDAALLLGHRRGTLSFEDRARARFRTEGLDAWTDDGSVRSWFALDGGTAVFATTKDLRARVLAAGEGRVPSLLRAAREELDAARTAFPPTDGDALLVVPAAFLRRADAREFRARRGLAMDCAEGLVEGAERDGCSRARVACPLPMDHHSVLSCPAGGAWFAAERGARGCTLHGLVPWPVPAGDLPPAPVSAPRASWGVLGDVVHAGRGFAVHLAAPASGASLSVLLPEGGHGDALDAALRHWAAAPRRDRGVPADRGLLAEGASGDALHARLRRAESEPYTGEDPLLAPCDAAALDRARRVDLLRRLGHDEHDLRVTYHAWTGRRLPPPDEAVPGAGVTIPPRPAAARILSVPLRDGASAAWR